MKTEQILQLVEAVSGFGLDEFEYEEDGVKLKLKKGGNVCTSVSAETAGRTKTEAEIARKCGSLIRRQNSESSACRNFLCVAGRRRNSFRAGRRQSRKGNGSRDRGSDEAYE